MRIALTFLFWGWLGLIGPLAADDPDRRAGRGISNCERGVAVAAAGQPAGVGSTAKPAENNSPPSYNVPGISCNWDGWQYGQSPLNCWRCQAHVDTLRTHCTNGMVTRVEKTRICIACWDGN